MPPSVSSVIASTTRPVPAITLTEAQIRWYVGTREPMDKAGSYAIQGIGALFIEAVQGSFSTVMGLPVERMGALFGHLGLLKPWMGFPKA